MTHLVHHATLIAQIRVAREADSIQVIEGAARGTGTVVDVGPNLHVTCGATPRRGQVAEVAIHPIALTEGILPHFRSAIVDVRKLVGAPILLANGREPIRDCSERTGDIECPKPIPRVVSDLKAPILMLGAPPELDHDVAWRGIVRPAHVEYTVRSGPARSNDRTVGIAKDLDASSSDLGFLTLLGTGVLRAIAHSTVMLHLRKDELTRHGTRGGERRGGQADSARTSENLEKLFEH